MCYFCLRWAPLSLTFAQFPHTILSPQWREQAACLTGWVFLATFAKHQDTWLWQSTSDSSFHKVTPKSLSYQKKENNVKFAQSISAAVSPEQPLLFSSIVKAEMPPPTCMRDSTGGSQRGDRLTERNETKLDLSELQIIFHFLLILRTILPCLGHKAAEKQHLDLSLDLRAAVIKRVKSSNFLE